MLDFPYDRFGKRFGGCLAAEIAGKDLAAHQNPLQSEVDPVRRFFFGEMLQEHHRRLNHGGRICNVFTFYIRRAAMNRFEERVSITEICPGDNSEAADETGGEV